MPASNVAWGGATLTVTVSGVDVSCSVVAVTVDRSKNRLWDPPDAGVAQLTLDLTAGGEPASRGPVGAAARIHVAYGVTGRYLFTGTVQRRRLQHSPDRGDVLVLDCVDEFEQLARVNRRAATTDTPEGGGEAVQQRLARWLNDAGSTSDRALGSSDFTCPETLIDGNTLRQLQVTALADGGDFFIAGDGTVTFLPWRWRDDTDTAAALFSDRRLHDWVPYSSVDYHDDLDEVQNDVTGTRRDDGTTPLEPQTATNPSSIATYGERGDPLDDLELEDDTQVATRVAAVVTVAAQPNPRFDSIVVQPAFDPARAWPRTIPVTFGSLVAANRVWEDGTQVALYGHVIGERWAITPTDATVEFRCSGTGTWDADRPPRAPIALERCPDGSVRIPPGYPCDQTSDVVIKDVDGNVLATYPPGSLCECGTVFIPDGGVEICLDDGVTQVCTPIDDPRLDALLWFDVLEPGPGLIERIDGDPVDGGPGYLDATLNAIPGGFDAMNATATGGVIGVGESSRVAATDLADGWTIDLWLYLAEDLGEDTVIDLVDLGVVKLQLRWDTLAPFNALTVEVFDGAATHLTSNMVAPTADAWQHWELRYSPAGGVIIVRLGGVVVHIEPFPHPPDEATGEWGVSLPGDARIGEVIVYGERPLFGEYDETVIADAPFAFWTLAEESTGLGAYDAAVVASDPYGYWILEAET